VVSQPPEGKLRVVKVIDARSGAVHSETLSDARMSDALCGSPMRRAEQIAKPAECRMRSAGFHVCADYRRPDLTSNPLGWTWEFVVH